MTLLARLTAVCAVALFATPALAHVDGGVSGGFHSGFMHPFLGWDHVVAMLAVGLWGASLGAPAIWVLPITFPLVMAFGGVLGVLGVPLFGVEAGIAASAMVFGLLVATVARPPIWVAGLIVAVFAIFHGHAHGTELPEAAAVLPYAIGFMLATGLLHLAGIGFGLIARWPAGRMAVRASGVAVAAAGVASLMLVLANA